MKLYSYFRSSASYRVRIAMNWKGLDYELQPVHLLREGGLQHSEEYKKINPMEHVPALEDEGFIVAESMAIFDYLDHVHPQKPLFPKDKHARAQVIQICEVINSGIQPLMNLKVLQNLSDVYGFDATKKEEWVRHWVRRGLASIEKILEKTAGTYCVGDAVTAADMFLVPQCFSSRRFQIKIGDYPTIASIEEKLSDLHEFAKAHPKSQPDFEA